MKKKIGIGLIGFFVLLICSSWLTNQKPKTEVEGLQIQTTTQAPLTDTTTTTTFITSPIPTLTLTPTPSPTSVQTPKPTIKPTSIPSVQVATPVIDAGCGTYINSTGNKVARPCPANNDPAGATAKCRDGTYSYSQSRRGTCSHHGGVAQWL